MKLTVPAIKAAPVKEPNDASLQAAKLLDNIDALLQEIVSTHTPALSGITSPAA